jgi:hypothetical protein
MFVDVSVPPVGDGADGAAAACFGVTFCFDGVAAKPTIASEMPPVHNRTATKLRELTKPDLEDEFFFMAGFV